jgi:hypothetical protein
MPRRKSPLPAPIHEWIDGKISVGEIVLAMAQALYEDQQNLIRSPKTNQLAAQADLQKRKKQFIAQVNAAFAEMNAYQTRQVKAGAAQKKTTGIPTAHKVEEIVNYLTAQGAKITAPAVEVEWFKRFNLNSTFGKPVTLQAIRKHLRDLKTKAT